MADDLAPQCIGRVASVSSSCGCTLTAASWQGLSPDTLKDFATKEIDLARVLFSSAEADMLGVPERGLTAILKGSLANIKGELSTRNVSMQSVILPYIQRAQESHVNDNYFAIEAGVATPGAGTNGLPVSAWDVTVNLGVSPWRTALTNIERFFPAGMSVYVRTWDSAQNALSQAFTIIKAENANSGSVQKAKLTLKPNVSATWWAANAGLRPNFQPEFGVLVVGANNIADREFWCHNMPSDLSKRIITNFVQTSRESYCVTDSYKKQLENVMSGKINEYQRRFVHQPLDKQRKQQKARYERAWLNSVFFGQRLDERQTPEYFAAGSVDSDYTVYDPVESMYGECAQEYKANALGIHTLLNDCNRVVDFGGNALDLNAIFEEAYNLKRNREANGGSIEKIDVMTDRHTADNIRVIMSRYYLAKYGAGHERKAKIGEKITFNGVVQFNYDEYQIPDQGVTLCVFHDPFFDDLIAATPDDQNGAPAGFKSRSRYLWFIDWSDVQVGIAGTRQAIRKHPDPDTAKIYRCVIEPNQTEYDLRSTKWTVMIDLPERHTIYENFSDECPTLNIRGCAPVINDSGSPEGSPE
jgi:hypothetical protein